MDSLSRYDVCIDGIQADTRTYHWTLRDDYFHLLDEQDIEHGQLNATLRVTQSGDAYDLDFDIAGYVEVPCDRCLCPMQQKIEVHETLTARLGNAYYDDGDTIEVAADTKTLNVAWNMFELIALALPIHHVHDDGQCEEAMQQLLASHTPHADDSHDTRWDALKPLLGSNTTDDNK